MDETTYRPRSILRAVAWLCIGVGLVWGFADDRRRPDPNRAEDPTVSRREP